jgi:NDP-sugar pyrophosphorylase family protein
MQAVILAGGLATRMRPATETTPKSLLSVAGRPFIEWQLEWLGRSGLDDVVVCVGHLGDAIEEHVGAGARFGVRVRYARDGASLRGTGGALRAAMPLLDDAFLVTYGDSYLLCDGAEPLATLLGRPEADAVMSVLENHGRFDRSNVRMDGERVAAYRKGATDPAFDHVDYGAIAFRRHVLGEIPAGVTVGLDVLLSSLGASGRLFGLRVTRRFFEIGSPEGLAELERHLREGRA